MKAFKVVARVPDKDGHTVGVWHGGDQVYIYDGVAYDLDADPPIAHTIEVDNADPLWPTICYPQDVVALVSAYVHDRDCDRGRFQNCVGDWRCPPCEGPCQACAEDDCGVFDVEADQPTAQVGRAGEYMIA